MNFHGKDIKIFSANSNRQLARQIAEAAEEAGEHLTFAAERGGPMYVGKEAAQLLRTLRQSPRDGKN